MKQLQSIVGRLASLLLVLCAVASASTASAQTPMGSTKPQVDTAIIFEPSSPLLQTSDEKARAYGNSFGFDASFSDYGFGGGLYYTKSITPALSAALTLDVGTAKGAREFGLEDEQKINRIFVIPIMASARYRVFENSLSDNLRPYLSAGAGPVVVMTTPYSMDYFPAFGHAESKVVPGGFVGVGANFGTDKKTTFGASLRYFIIPYPGSIQSTSAQSLNDLSGLFLTVNYGFNF